MSLEGKMIRLTVNRHYLDEFLERFSWNVRGSRQEPGCLLFRVARSPTEETADGPAIFYIWEEFVDAEAVAQHRNTPHFREWAAWWAGLPPDTLVRTGFATQPLLVTLTL